MLPQEDTAGNISTLGVTIHYNLGHFKPLGFYFFQDYTEHVILSAARRFSPIFTCSTYVHTCVETNKSYQLNNHEDWLNNYWNDGPEQKAIKCCCPVEFITMIDDSLLHLLMRCLSYVVPLVPPTTILIYPRLFQTSLEAPLD